MTARIALLILAALQAPPPANAEDQTTARETQLLEIIDKMQEQIDELEERVRNLEGKERTAPNQTAPEAPAPEHQQPAAQLPSETTAKPRFAAEWRDRLHFSTPDGALELKIGGRLFNDWVWQTQSGNLRRFHGPLEDGTEFRRARIHIGGTLYDNVFFLAMYDFAGGDADFNDVYMGVKDIPYVGRIRVGHVTEPFGMEELTYNKFTTFMERSLTSTLVPGYNTGAMAYNTAFDDRMTWALGVFRDTDAFGNGMSDGGYNLTGRVTGLPWRPDEGNNRLVHLGAAYSHRRPKDGLGFAARPESHLLPVPIIEVGSWEARQLDLYGLEAALQWGRFLLQSEYIGAQVEWDRGSRDYFDSFYVAASCFLTDDHRSYDPEEGIFSRTRPRSNFAFRGNKGWGAWELGLRYSYVDLNEFLLARYDNEDLSWYWRGGTLEDYTIGLNWQLNPNARVMFNYIKAYVDHPHIWDEASAEIFQMRFQVDF